MKSMFIPIVAVLLASGCANTKIKMSVADLDFRKPAQIEAGIRENEVFYQTEAVDKAKATAAEGQAKAMPIAFYEKLFDMISKLECRIRLFSFESAPAVVK